MHMHSYAFIRWCQAAHEGGDAAPPPRRLALGHIARMGRGSGGHGAPGTVATLVEAARAGEGARLRPAHRRELT